MSMKIRQTLAAVLAALLLAFVVPQTTIAYVDIGAGTVFAGKKNGHNGDGDGHGDGIGGGHHSEGNSGEHKGQGKHA
jgi:hypothetical protein